LIGGKRTIWAECLFVDPVADLAVLGGPDNQVFCKEWDGYIDFTESVTPMAVADLPLARSPIMVTNVFGTMELSGPAEWKGTGRLLSLDGRWFSCGLRAFSRSLWVEGRIIGGMSGSPIINDDGAAVGVVCMSDGSRGGGPNPFLARQLPAWILESIKAARE
jgi:hypothetical protein